ncbi:MFS transporter [Halopseudomonas aestusnigri]|uniref:Sugar phosphate permease n=1 Tax=Halopseudomonas aestusnigri TaxID=857252 RepID=A0AAQ1GA72_9GAMM|nr:MFS transporter [Halopseudomonas aestusnigri]OWL83329.1 MFS transporter [Halopseudomonas aestusnigri]SEG73261.1 Sugar phosphate permease [Halopseudomonas aestusnigri]
MTAQDTLYRPKTAWTIAGLLATMMLVNFLDKVVIGLVAVPMMRDLDLTPAEFGLIGGSLHWLFAMAAVAGGFLANHKPTRTLLLIMAAFWSVIQLPMLLATSVWAIIACRVLLGIGEGPASPIATHALYKWFPDNKRSLPVALLHSGSSLGLLVAGLMIPWVTLHWGWRANFAVLAVLGFVWCLAWLKFGEEGRLDQARASQLPTSSERLPYRRLLSDRTVLSNYVCHFAANWSLALTLTWVPTYLEVGLGIDSLNTGRLFALFVVVTTPLSLIMAWWSQDLMRRGFSSRLARCVFVSISLIISGLLAFAQTMPDIPVAARVTLMTLSGGFALVMYSVGPAILGEITPASQRGSILAMGNGFASIAGLSAPVVTGLLVQNATGHVASGYEQGFMVTGAILIVSGLLGLLYMNPARSQSTLGTGDSAAAATAT